MTQVLPPPPPPLSHSGSSWHFLWGGQRSDNDVKKRLDLGMIGATVARASTPSATARSPPSARVLPDKEDAVVRFVFPRRD